MKVVDGISLSCRQRSARVITYKEFQQALEELAPKRFKGQSKEAALQSIHKLVEGQEPTNVGVTVSLRGDVSCSVESRLVSVSD